MVIYSLHGPELLLFHRASVVVTLTLPWDLLNHHTITCYTRSSDHIATRDSVPTLRGCPCPGQRLLSHRITTHALLCQTSGVLRCKPTGSPRRGPLAARTVTPWSSTRALERYRFLGCARASACARPAVLPNDYDIAGFGEPPTIWSASTCD